MSKINLCDERLPSPTKLVQAPIGIVEEYIIPYDKKKEVLGSIGCLRIVKIRFHKQLFLLH